ncbi:MAG: zinc-ribbon domain-containing protein [Chloroflexota bacterium]|nr:zinc-ribbon domain-containing protein [Chloroflexota bacterium]
MDYHERDRRESPDAEDASSSSADPARPGTPEHSGMTDDAAPEAPPMTEPAAEAMGTAEIESWPSQDATLAAGPEEAPSAAWPTEPPDFGATEAGGWPTTPPERGDEPIREPRWETTPEPAAEPIEPPPSEVEAYPAGTGVDASGAAAAAGAAGTAAHAVPATEGGIGESTQCPRCGTENRPGLAFCRNCGQRLVAAGVASTVERPGTAEGTMACPRCGTHNRAGVAFCQNCGANLRGTAPGYVPPAVPAEPGAETAAAERRGAVLGPVVLLIGLVGIITGYLLPFLYGSGSLYERAIGPGGYGIAFWAGYPEVGANLTDQAYFGLAGPVPILGVLLLVLAIAGFLRAVPGPLQTIGLGITLLWSVGLIVLFIVVELAGNWSGDLVGMLRNLTPAGIIFMLASLIVLIGTLTRFGRS